MSEKKKFGKFLALATAAGAVAAGVSYFLKYRSFHKELDQDFHDFEHEDDDDFDGSLPHESEAASRTYVTNWKLKRRLEMKRYEYMTVDLSAEPSFNVHVKLDRYIAKLNEYGKQGWRLISGTDDWKYSIFEREIEDKEE